MQRRKRNKFDTVGTGLLTGALLPILIFFATYLTKGTQVPFGEYINGMWQMQALVKIGTLCVFANTGIDKFNLIQRFITVLHYSQEICQYLCRVIKIS